MLEGVSQRRRQLIQQLYGNNDMPEGQPSLLKMAGGVLAYPPHIAQVHLLTCVVSC